VAALIDFGDVMTGWGEYDLLGPSTFAAAGMPGRVRSLLRGYGYSEVGADVALPRRLMTLLLLHRFSNLAVQICIEGWQQKAADLYELERLLWPIWRRCESSRAGMERGFGTIDLTVENKLAKSAGGIPCHAMPSFWAEPGKSVERLLEIC
jgi:hypothetical protein